MPGNKPAYTEAKEAPSLPSGAHQTGSKRGRAPKRPLPANVTKIPSLADHGPSKRLKSADTRAANQSKSAIPQRPIGRPGTGATAVVRPIREAAASEASAPSAQPPLERPAAKNRLPSKPLASTRTGLVAGNTTERPAISLTAGKPLLDAKPGPAVRPAPVQKRGAKPAQATHPAGFPKPTGDQATRPPHEEEPGAKPPQEAHLAAKKPIQDDAAKASHEASAKPRGRPIRQAAPAQKTATRPSHGKEPVANPPQMPHLAATKPIGDEAAKPSHRPSAKPTGRSSRHAAPAPKRPTGSASLPAAATNNPIGKVVPAANAAATAAATKQPSKAAAYRNVTSKVDTGRVKKRITKPAALLHAATAACTALPTVLVSTLQEVAATVWPTPAAKGRCGIICLSCQLKPPLSCQKNEAQSIKLLAAQQSFRNSSWACLLWAVELRAQAIVFGPLLDHCCGCSSSG